MTNRALWVCAMLAAMLALTTPGFPQSNTDTIRGKVEDQTGAGVPGATVRLGEAVGLLQHAGQRVRIEEDQRNTVILEARYDQLPRGFWLAFGGRHDSGYSVELDPDVTRQDFAGEFPAPILDQVNFDRGFVRPHSVLQLSLGKELRLNEHASLSAQFNVRNLTGTFYLITFESVFSGTTIGRPRSYSGKLSLRFK